MQPAEITSGLTASTARWATFSSFRTRWHRASSANGGYGVQIRPESMRFSRRRGCAVSGNPSDHQQSVRSDPQLPSGSISDVGSSSPPSGPLCRDKGEVTVCGTLEKAVLDEDGSEGAKPDRGLRPWKRSARLSELEINEWLLHKRHSCQPKRKHYADAAPR